VQQKQIAKVLAPLKEDVFSKQTEIKKFDLTQTKEGLEDAKTAAKDAAREGIEKLVTQFEDGKISAGKFSTLLRRQLSPALDILKSKGKNLGLSFERGFLRNVDDLVKQAGFLVGFLGGPESSKAISPAKTRREADKRIADAQKNLDKAIASQQETARNTSANGAIVKALEAINAALRPKPNANTKPPKAGIGSPSTSLNDAIHNRTGAVKG
jgi:hypothetical protein